ncbi:MAG: TIGR02266 family protein [Deltaproteobacteria bacterium]|nr:TIGR02266 family protein [Deltaproteobacteria bacterium]
MANVDEADAKPNPADNRTSARAPIRLRVDYERMNSFFADYTKNISKGGTFIKTARPLPIKTQFVFALSVPALSEPVQLTGEVTWTMTPEQAAGKEGEEAGMGIRFVFADDAARGEFESLVVRLMEESLGPEVAAALLKQ